MSKTEEAQKLFPNVWMKFPKNDLAICIPTEVKVCVPEVSSAGKQVTGGKEQPVPNAGKRVTRVKRGKTITGAKSGKTCVIQVEFGFSLLLLLIG